MNRELTFGDRMKLKAALIASLALVSASCSGLGRGGFREPLVNFKDVRVGGLGLNGGTLDIVLSVYNPNNFRLDASRLTYQLMVDTLPLGSGATDKHFAVPSNDSAEVDLPLRFTWSGASAAARQLINNGSVPYRVLGDLTVGSSVGDFTIQYDRTGNFNSMSGTTH
jgi:LEA14-like dessication related protein